MAVDKRNILRIRGDSDTLELLSNGSKFSFSKETQSPAWLPKQESDEISLSELRNGLEPWLTSLCQSEHLSLLTGTGLSNAIQYMATGSSNILMNEPQLEGLKYANAIKSAVAKSAERNNRGNANIEDYIRTINELIRGFEILGCDNQHVEVLQSTNEDFYQLDTFLERVLNDFAENISALENSIATSGDELREEAFVCLINFLMSFANRAGTRERLNIFTTNYDRLIEAGAELAGLYLVDRFVGSLAPIFRSSRLDIDMHYNPPGIRGEPRYLEGVVRFTKLHGSLDWISTGRDIRRFGLPFGSKDIKSFLNAPGLQEADARKLMIYPNSTKDRETAEYPYVELFRDFAAALCRPNSTLITYGYGFGDDHINRIIRDMLTIPSTHLVVISFNDVDGRIMKKIGEFGRNIQISLVIGEELANIKTLVDYFLPRPSIDRASIKMCELLRQRYPSADHITTSVAMPTEGGVLE